MKYFFIIIFLFYTNIIAQVSLGFTVEGTGMITDKTSRLAPISCISFVLGFSPVESLIIEAKVGYEPVIAEYNGWEFSGYLNYKIKDPFYLIGGVHSHSNDSYSSNLEGTTAKGIILFGLGAGIKMVSFLSLEFIYHIPSKKEDWIYHLDHTALKKFSSEKLTGVIKANFKFSWDL